MNETHCIQDTTPLGFARTMQHGTLWIIAHLEARGSPGVKTTCGDDICCLSSCDTAAVPWAFLWALSTNASPAVMWVHTRWCTLSQKLIKPSLSCRLWHPLLQEHFRLYQLDFAKTLPWMWSQFHNKRWDNFQTRKRDCYSSYQKNFVSINCSHFCASFAWK